MSNSSFHLYQLQKVDLRLDQIGHRLHLISTLLSSNPKLQEAQTQVNNCLEAITQCETKIADLEKISSAKGIKIQQSEAALYNGKNSNPKELKDLQVEIESLKRVVSTVVEEQLALMAEVDDLNQKLIAIKVNFDSVLAESDRENQHLINEKNTLEKENEKLLKERQAATSQIPAEILATYELIRKAKNHIAVAAIEDQSCATCGSEITASDIQKARSSTSLSFCPSCGRILYAG
ncbi:MAG: zinc ribbon domain-containing protein [Anaerolineaceae bacterium]